eukprot:SM000073S21428  [mRNA]  locus=s73:135026:136929:- [translate_table: standard]
MAAALAAEMLAVHFVTAVVGLDWHRKTRPLPDMGQWLLLALNERVPPVVRAFLQADVVGLHHYLMLFIMLGFSVLFGSVQPPGLGLGARYCFSMAVGRLLRTATFLGTILPSPRPWCAAGRFETTPAWPHPWAQKYYVPYAEDNGMILELLHRDMCFAPQGQYPEEYRPDWGMWSFLVDFIRPPDPAVHGVTAKGLHIRPGGGCNDLAFSGHMLVAVLTAAAWQEAHPGWSALVVWIAVLHSGQREIRERHHYTVDIVAGLYVGILLWRSTKFLWKREDAHGQAGRDVESRDDQLVKAAKDGDLDRVRALLNAYQAHEKDEEAPTATLWLLGAIIILVCVTVALTIFQMFRGG